jgi:hypothetical protein
MFGSVRNTTGGNKSGLPKFAGTLTEAKLKLIKINGLKMKPSAISIVVRSSHPKGG